MSVSNIMRARKTRHWGQLKKKFFLAHSPLGSVLPPATLAISVLPIVSSSCLGILNLATKRVPCVGECEGGSVIVSYRIAGA